MRLQHWLCSIAICVAAASCSWLQSTPEQNVLLIVVDSLRFDAISDSIGAARTPNLQRLAEDGVAFTGCYSHSPLGLPATASLFSGRTPHKSGVLHSDQGLPAGLPLFSEELRDHGYQTLAAVSRVHTMPAQPVGAATGTLARGFARYEAPDEDFAPAPDVMREALDLLSATETQRGWFLFAQFSDPSEPYEAYDTAKNSAHIVLDGDLVDSVSTSNSTRWKHEVVLAPGKHQISFRSASSIPVRVRSFRCTAGEEELKSTFDQGGGEDGAKTVVVTVENPGSDAATCQLHAWIQDVPSVSQIRDRYRMEVEAVDKAIGAIIDDLKAREQYDDTLIVVTASHGEALGEHGDVGDPNLYDELLRVPLIVKLVRDDPALPSLRKRRHHLIRQVDVAPTVLELLGAGSLSSADGTPFLESGEREFTAEVGPPESSTRRYAIRDDRYKMIYDATERKYEMFDLRVDTLELENVFMLQGHLRIEWQTRLRKLADGPLWERVKEPAPEAPPANG